MSRDVDWILPVSVYRVGDTCFSPEQVAKMIERTNRKLLANDTGIQIEVQQENEISEKSMAYIIDDILEETVNGVTVKNDRKYNELVQLLTDNGSGPSKCLDNGSGPNKCLRIFLVKAHFRGHDSWTYDPVTDPADSDVWGGAIFITEKYNDNDDDRYVDLGLLPTNDSLLHELGHVLMQESRHYQGDTMNFFHESAALTDDTILPYQVLRMRGEAPVPNYLVQKSTATG